MMSLQKILRIESKAVRQAARGSDCTLNIAGVCLYDSDTTVLCHFPDESNGKGRKSDDVSAGFGCSACHDAYDGRGARKLTPYEKEFYARRSMVRTLRRLVEREIVSIKGMSL